MNFDALYAILAAAANAEGQLFYSQLSQRYHDATGDWHEPHGSWDAPLGQLNQMLHTVGWPALSAVVVLQATSQPGGGFWGSSPNVPANGDVFVYQGILAGVYAVAWPDVMPVAPPPA